VRTRLSYLLASALIVAGATDAAAQAADTVLVNGKIITVDAPSSVRSALAIRGGRVAALGADADVRRLAGPGDACDRSAWTNGHSRS
jgi:hypothetical protein